MGYLVIENFQGGLDTRKARLAAPAGTLTEGVDGHITPGGEFEKRKAFVALVNPNGSETDSLPPGTFGLQPVAGGLMVFGSADQTGLQWPDDADGNEVTYQRLQHPAVLAGESYSAGSHAMTAVIHSEVYGGSAFVIAEFADGNRFCYYEGQLIDDFTAGLILPYLAGAANNPKIAVHLKSLVDALPNYSAAIVGPYATTHRAHSGTQATLTIGAHTLQIGEKVYVTGIATAGYNVTGAALLAKTATTITYNTATTLTEGTTAETGGTVKTGLVDIDGGLGVPFTATADTDSVAGLLDDPDNTVSPVSPIDGASAVGAFSITGGTDDGVTVVAATGTITRTSTNAAAGSYVQIGRKKYTFRAAGTLAVEGDVLIGASASESLTNLKAAINHEPGAGTTYICAWAHPWVYAQTISGSNLPLKAYAGSHANSISLVASSATYWSAPATTPGTAMSGGAGNCIGSVKVVSPTGTETELLAVSGGSPTPIRYQTNPSATAAQVRDAITANAGVSGYTATINENRVTILSADNASPMPNGYQLQIASGGNVLVGECMFYLTQQANPFTLNSILADTTNCLPSAQIFDNTGATSTNPLVDTLPEYYSDLATKMNLRSGITGVNAWSAGTYLKMSRITTRSDDIPLPVYVTPAAANTAGVVFDKPPALAIPMTVTLPEFVSAPGKLGVGPIGVTLAIPVVLTAAVVGGNGLYTYEWFAEYPGLESGQVTYVPSYNTSLTFSADYDIVVSPTTSRSVTVSFQTSPGNTGGNYNYDIQPAVIRYTVRCRVTDSFGNVATSGPCEIEWQIV